MNKMKETIEKDGPPKNTPKTMTKENSHQKSSTVNM